MAPDPKKPILALVDPGGKIDPAFIKAAKEEDFRVVFALGPGDIGLLLPGLSKAGAGISKSFRR